MWTFNSNIYLQIVILHDGRRRASNMLSWQSALMCVPCQSRNPSCLTRVTRATQLTQTLGSRLPHCFLLVVSLIFPQCRLKISVCILPRAAVLILHFTRSLRFTLSLQSAFYTQSAFYPWSAVCSPQSAVCVLHWPNHLLFSFTLRNVTSWIRLIKRQVQNAGHRSQVRAQVTGYRA